MYILRCSSFDSEQSARYSNKCCKGDCHDRDTLINVTPYAADATLENRTLDWTLGIQGLVCCGRYEFVRSLSREWWIRKLAAIENWGEDQVRVKLAVGSWHRVFDREGSKITVRQSQVKSSKVKSSSECPNCGSKWNETVCDGCGHSE